jgi:glycosyltransferase involved in cell wall biosynthesis
MDARATSVLLLTVGDHNSPGTRLRSLAYVPYLEDRGFEVRVLVPLGSDPNRVRRRRLLRPVELVRDLAAASRADVVVVYRKTFPGATAKMLRRAASKIVYEYDDAVYLPSPDEPQGVENLARYRRNFLSTVAAADLVVAGNHHLAREATARNIEVLPTGVDLSIFEPGLPRTEREPCVIGWIGTAGNLPQWTALMPVFERVAAENPAVRFKIVSNGEPPRSDLPVVFERFTIDREAACLADFDIGLMPLEDTPWNRGKCSYKALQCMAMGMPVVVSPVGMNREVVEDGVSGFFASTEDEWLSALLRMAGDSKLRSQLGGAARRVVEASFSLEQIGAKMADLIEELVTECAGSR